MAEPLNPAGREHAVRTLIAFLVVGLTNAAATAVAAPATAPAASIVSDPTLPPAGFAAPNAHALGDGAASDRPNRAPDAMLVQMIVRTGNSRYAVIDGRTVRQGDSIDTPDGPLRIEQIDPDAVRIRLPGAHEIKTLFLNATPAGAPDIRRSVNRNRDEAEKR